MVLRLGRRIALLLAASSLSATGAGIAAMRGAHACGEARAPTRLDFLALASMADTAQPFALTAYHPTSREGLGRPPPIDSALEEPVRFEEEQPLML